MKLIGRFTPPLALSPAAFFALGKTFQRSSGRGCCPAQYSGACTTCMKTQTRSGNNVYVYRTAPEHIGTDLTVACGEPVRAAAGGRVTTAHGDGGYHGGAGNYVEINHENGYASRYLHHSQTIVAKGQRVRRRQVIGYVGSTGASDGCHSHYELYSNVPPEVENIYGYPGKVRLPEMEHMALIPNEWAIGVGVVAAGLILSAALGVRLSRRA